VRRIKICCFKRVGAVFFDKGFMFLLFIWRDLGNKLAERGIVKAVTGEHRPI
jgi:hypothetical protein